MDIPKRTVTVSRGLTYSYLYRPSSSSKPYVLFLHGFPSLPVDYHNQISHLSSLGYGIIAPELLGYGNTSHPAESNPYRLKLVSNDLVDILDHHSVSEVLAVGHDWGVTLLTRMEFFHPRHISKMALLTIGCAPMGQPFDLDSVNDMTKQHMGYEGFGYMTFFTRNPDAAKIINSHQDSFRSLWFQSNPELWKDYIGAIGGMEKWLDEDRRTQTIKSFTNEIEKEHRCAFSKEKGGYAGALKWYENHVSGRNAADEEAELKARGLQSYQTSKPVLQILATSDPIALPPVHQQMTQAFAPHAKFVYVDSGHWVMLESAKFVNKALEDFFAE